MYGGEADEDDLYISPTIMQNVTGDDLIMQEEIFGPLLPIIKKETIQEAIEFINERYILFLQSLLFSSSALPACHLWRYFYGIYYVRKILRKTNISYSWYAHVRVRIRG